MKINLDSLAVEITRRCNMACDHCLRGDAENIDMSEIVIRRIAESVNSIYHLTLTGGEPSLNTEGIKSLRRELGNRGVCVHSFFIATNGKDTEKILDLSREALLWNAYTIECGGESEINGVALSYDQYHEPIPVFNEQILRGLSFFSEGKMYDEIRDAQLINEGRARENNLAFNDNATYTEVELSDGEVRAENTIFINVHGDVLNGCDWSFESQKKMKWGNIMEEPLLDILLRHVTVDERRKGA